MACAVAGTGVCITRDYGDANSEMESGPDEGTKHPERRHCVAGRFLRSRENQTFGTGGIWLTGSTAFSAMKAIRSASDRLRTRSFSIMLAR